MVHDRKGTEIVVLALSKVQQRDNGCFLVLAWVAGQNFLDSFLILAGKGKGNSSMICRSIAMNKIGPASIISSFEHFMKYRTHHFPVFIFVLEDFEEV